MLRLSLRTKIILVGTIPFLLYLISAGISVSESYSAYRRAEANFANADKILRVSALIHELQKERGKSNSFLGGSIVYSQIQDQVAVTDTKIDAISDADFWPSESAAGLQKLRQSVKDKTGQSSQVVAGYRNLISNLMDVEINLVNQSRGTPVESKMVSILILERAKESAGRLRANLSGVLATNAALTDEQINLLIGSKGGVEVSLGSPALHVSDEMEKQIKSFDQSKEWKEVGAAFSTVIRKSKEGGYNIDPLTIFAHATTAIDRLATFVQSQVEEVKTFSSERRASMLRSCSISTIMAVFIALMVSLVISFTVVSTTKPIFTVVDNLNKASAQLSFSSDELKDASNKIAEAASESAASIQETSSAIEEISSMVAKNSDNAQRVKETSEAGRNHALNGKEVMEEMVAAIDVIKGSQDNVKAEIDDTNLKIRNIVTLISEIKSKTQVINEIVFQTKLLSFNASVEAARAGEHGKGFSVVAEEIGQLAQMSGQAAQDISQMLDKSTQDVVTIIEESTARTGELIRDAGEKVNVGMSVSKKLMGVFDEIVGSVNGMTSMIAEISAASQEQATGVGQVASAMTELDQANQQNASASTQAAQSASSLATEVVRLKEVVGMLKQTIFAEQASVLAAGGSHENQNFIETNDQEEHLKTA